MRISHRLKIVRFLTTHIQAGRNKLPYRRVSLSSPFHDIASISSQKACRNGIQIARFSAPALRSEQSTPGTSIPFILTDIGEGIKEVELLQWFVQPGDVIRQFDKVCEVQSDKATVDITSRYDGVVLKINHSVGDLVATGSTLIEILPEADSSSSTNVSQSAPSEPVLSSVLPAAGVPPIAAPEPAPITVASTNKGAGDGHHLATPAVRRVAREHGIDLSLEGHLIRPTGPDGRLLKSDILLYVKSRGKAAPMMQPSVEHSLKDTTSTRPATTHYDPTPPANSNLPVGKKVPIRGMQRVMLEQMRNALAIPHMVYCDEIHMDRLVALRQDLKRAMAAVGDDTVQLSYLPILMKIVSLALKQFPYLNSSLSTCEGSVVLYDDHNIGVAMDTKRGLVVPNIKKVQSLSIMEIASELKRLQVLGAEGRLGAAELSGGTFTLSNIGSIGGTYASPVILTPQVAIGALGRMQTLPRFDAEGKVVAQAIMHVSWSADHRIIDGGTLARFSNLCKRYIENPTIILSEVR